MNNAHKIVQEVIKQLIQDSEQRKCLIHSLLQEQLSDSNEMLEDGNDEEQIVTASTLKDRAIDNFSERLHDLIGMITEEIKCVDLLVTHDIKILN